MRIRQRLVRNPGTMSRTCRLRSSLDVVRTYHESCNKSPATLHVEDEVKRKGPQLEGLLQTYKGCSTILDERPKYFRYGNCLSVKQYYAPYAETELTLVHETASESSKDFVGCGNSDWVTSSSMTRFELGFKGVETARSYQPHAKAKYLSYEDWINSPKRFDLQLEAMESFIPDLENGFSLPVFLMEFRDLPRLAQDVKRAFQAMKSAILGLIALIKGNSGAARRKRKKLRALLTMSISEISGDFLSYNFGWLPFVGEVTEIISRIMTFKEDLDRFFKWNGKYMTLHYQKWLAPETFRDAEWLNTTQATSNTISATSSQWDFADDVFNAVYFDGTISRSVSDVRYTATCFFRYSFSGGDALYNRIWAGLDRFGINLSPSDIWEIIPFSFVVDWIYDVGSWLGNYDFQNVPIVVEILDFCDSITYKYREIEETDFGSIYVDSPSSRSLPTTGWTLENPSRHAACYSEHVYYRLRDTSPNMVREGIQLTLPSGKQWLLAAALVGVRLHANRPWTPVT